MTMFSVCIPRIFNNIPNQKITDTFEKMELGKIKNMDIIHKIGRDGTIFKMAFIHFDYWNMNSIAAVNLKNSIENPQVEAKLVYDDPWYWIVLPNKSVVQTQSSFDNQWQQTSTTPSPNTPINTYTNTDTDTDTLSLTSKINSISKWMEERLTNLEDELHCVYEELYQREYIPTKYREESHWDGDIETGSYNADDLYDDTPFQPLTMEDLDTSHIDNSYTHDVTFHDELHKPHNSNLANIVPFMSKSVLTGSNYYDESIDGDDVSLLSVTSTHYQNSPYDSSYDIESGIPTKLHTTSASQYDKHWMTANYCGND